MRQCPRCQSRYEAEARFCPLDGVATIAAGEGTQVIDPMLGATVGRRYRILRKRGQGGMGAVYEAEHTALGKTVAIKILLPRYSNRRDVLARFHKEARAASMIAHENVVQVLDAGEEDGQAYMVMELLEGRDLALVLQEEGPFDPARALPIVAQMARALAAAHDKGIVHRDMKPENVLLVERGGRRDVVKVMDFGISKVHQEEESPRLTETGVVLGTPLYMSPEQGRGDTDVDHRADLYALGVMMYEMLVGAPPFVRPSYVALIQAHLSETPAPPRKIKPELPVELERIVLCAMEKQPRARFQSAWELEEALYRFAVRAGLAPADAEAPARARRRRRTFSAALGLGAAAALVGVALLVPRWRAEALGRRAVAATAPTPTPPPMATRMSAPGPVVTQLPAAAALPAPTPRARVTLSSAPAGAEVTIDGVPAGTTPLERALAPGPHRFAFRQAGYAAREVEQSLADGESRDVAVELEPLPSAVTAPPAARPHRPARPRPHPASSADADGHKSNPY